MTPPEQEPVRGAHPDLVDALHRLAILRDRDVLTEEEYQQAKIRLAEQYRSVTAPTVRGVSG
jgi:hypothetical protein